jgi:ABC-2 type transport system ATP-binding protein
MDLVRSLFAIGTRDFEERSAQLLRVLSLSADAGKLVREASYGTKKKTALAMALLPNPRVLILDEPLEGLDPVMVVNVKRALRSAVSRDMTVFLTTHLLATADDLITHYGIVRQGCLVAQGTTRELTSKGITLEEEYLRHFEDAAPGELTWLG